MTDVHEAGYAPADAAGSSSISPPAREPAAVAATEGFTHDTAPVFLDPIGRRRRWLTLAALIVAMAGALLLAAVLGVLFSPAPTMNQLPVPGLATSVPVASAEFRP